MLYMDVSNSSTHLASLGELPHSGPEKNNCSNSNMLHLASPQQADRPIGEMKIQEVPTKPVLTEHNINWPYILDCIKPEIKKKANALAHEIITDLMNHPGASSGVSSYT